MLRYSAFLAAFPSLLFTSIQTNICHIAVTLSQIGVCLVVASSGIIFAYRVSAIWNGNKAVYGIVGLFYTAMLGSWVSFPQHGKHKLLTVSSDCSGQAIPSYHRPSHRFRKQLYFGPSFFLVAHKLRLICCIRHCHSHPHGHQGDLASLRAVQSWIHCLSRFSSLLPLHCGHKYHSLDYRGFAVRIYLHQTRGTTFCHIDHRDNVLTRLPEPEVVQPKAGENQSGLAFLLAHERFRWYTTT